MPVINCKHCGSEFKRKLSQINYAKENFCSSFCQHESRKSGQIKDCFICRQKIYRQNKFLKQSQTGKFFCSKECSLVWQNSEFVGDKHPNWTTGEYSYRTVLKKTKDIQECCQCGKDDKRILIAHHLDKNRKNNKAENLVWLCRNCHHLIHYYVKKEFLAKSK